MKRQYLVLIEKGPTSYGAYAPDVPGCGTSGDTVEEAIANIKEALELYIEVATDRGEDIPVPNHLGTYLVEVDVPAPTASAT
jgi:predicted RNase H-like HicB family nuclease